MNTREQEILAFRKKAVDAQILRIWPKTYSYQRLINRKPDERVFHLETGYPDEEDILIGKNLDAVLHELAERLGWSDTELPSGWTLVEILEDFQQAVNDRIRELPTRSYSPVELFARKPLENVYRLKTDNPETDDLIPGEDIDDAILNLARCRGLDGTKLPDGWILVEILMDEEHELEPYR